MKISRMANENDLPDWAFGNQEKQVIQMSREQAGTVSIKTASQVTEEDIVDERSRIEQCAANKSTYYYNKNWNDEHKSALREYAMVVGLPEDKMIGVDPDKVQRAVEASEDQGMVRTASSKPEQPKLVLNDPFKLDELGDDSHMKEANWEQVTKESKLAAQPIMMSNAIIPIAGGEDYFKNSEPQRVRGRNSILDPTAIEDYANSEEQDTGQRLAAEREAREQARVDAIREADQKKVEEAPMPDFMKGGMVFKTEDLVAQPGLNAPSSQMGVYADFNPDNIPEKTEGERIADVNEQRRQEIQRPDKEEEEFTVQKANTRTISDSFTDSLKAQLSKIPKKDQ